MRRWAGCSDARPLRAGRTAAHRCRGAAVLLALCLGGALGPAQAKVFLTQEEALKLAFPGEAAPERKTAFLTDAQAERARAEAGQPVASRVVTYYELGGVTAWFDTHVVRTLPETIMVVVEKDGAIRRIDVLSFSEPEDYLPRPRWNQQLHGRKLDEELSLRRGIRPLTGATLSARAVVSASRRILALHRVLVAAP